jgi:hypothetical protein
VATVAPNEARGLPHRVGECLQLGENALLDLHLSLCRLPRRIDVVQRLQEPTCDRRCCQTGEDAAAVGTPGTAALREGSFASTGP